MSSHTPLIFTISELHSHFKTRDKKYKILCRFISMIIKPHIHPKHALNTIYKHKKISRYNKKHYTDHV